MRRLARHLSWSTVLLLVGGCATAPPPAPRAIRSPAERVDVVRPVVRQAAGRHGVPEVLVLGVIQVESGFRPDARSHVGARGLMQLMPRTAASLARRLSWPDYDVLDPAFNVEAGTAYLGYLLGLFDGDVELALAAYNAGPFRVQSWQRQGRGLSPPVRRYVAAVLAARDHFAGLAPPGPSLDPNAELDRTALRELLREREQLYGERPDVPLPDDAPPDPVEPVAPTTMMLSPAGPTARATATAPARSRPGPPGESGSSAAPR